MRRNCSMVRRVLTAALAASMLVLPASAAEETGSIPAADLEAVGEIGSEDFADELSVAAEAENTEEEDEEALEAALAENAGAEEILSDSQEESEDLGSDEILEELEAGEEAEVPADFSFADAVEVSVNKSCGDGLGWYKFTIPEDGTVSIFVGYDRTGNRAPYDGNNYYAYRVTVFTDERDEVFEATNKYDVYDANCYKGTSQTVGLKAGEYYFSIADDFNGKYCTNPVFKVNYTATSSWEKEFNESMDAAQEITSGKEVNGTIRSGGDQDWYKITVTKNGYFTVDFSIDHTGSSNQEYWNMQIMDEDQNILAEASYDPSSSNHETGRIGVAPGNYYVRIIRWPGSRSYSAASVTAVSGYVYTVKYDFTAVSAWETEYNDTLETADVITENTNEVGSLSREGDVDYYKVEWKGGPAILEFSHANCGAGGSWNYWYVNVLDASGNSVGGSGIGNHTEYSEIICGEDGVLAAGTYYIYIRHGSYDFWDTTPYTVRLALADPEIQALTNAWDGVTLRWNAIEGADSYNVYRQPDGGSWKLVGNSKGTGYYDKSAQSNTSYTYLVRAVRDGREGISSATNGIWYVENPVIDSVTNVSGGVKIQWSASIGATSYYVYRKEGQAGTWTFLKGVTTLNYTDTTAENGKVYYYAVKAAIYENGDEVTKSASSSAKNTYYLKNVYISGLTNSAAGTMKMTSSKNDVAAKYCFKYSTSPSMTNPVFASTKWTNLTVSGLTKGKTYYVQVRVCKTIAGYTFYSAWSSVKSVKITK